MAEQLTQLVRTRAGRPPPLTECEISNRACVALLERARSTRSRYPPTLLPSPAIDSLQPLSASQRARIGAQAVLARNAALRKAHGVVLGRASEVLYEDTFVDALLPAVARLARDSHFELTAQLKRQHCANGSTTRDAERWLAYTRDLTERADRMLSDERDAEASVPVAPQPEFADIRARTSELMALYERVLGPTP